MSFPLPNSGRHSGAGWLIDHASIDDGGNEGKKSQAPKKLGPLPLVPFLPIPCRRRDDEEEKENARLAATDRSHRPGVGEGSLDDSELGMPSLSLSSRPRSPKFKDATGPVETVVVPRAEQSSGQSSPRQESQPAPAGPRAMPNVPSKQSQQEGGPREKKWDIFLSYRVAADEHEHLVKDIYWQLCRRPISVHGKERPLSVFWDIECLPSIAGQQWEEKFADAICSSLVVVLVMSRGTFTMPDKHDVTALKKTSRCDNVILEYNLALELHALYGVSIMPIFVGTTKMATLLISSKKVANRPCKMTSSLTKFRNASSTISSGLRG